MRRDLETQPDLETRAVSPLMNAWARYKLRRCAVVGAAPSVVGRVWIHGGGRIAIGDNVLFDGTLAPIELHVQRGAVLSISDGTCLEGGTSIEAQVMISIGPGCRLGAYSKLIDNHFHPVHGDRLKRPPSTPLVLEEEVTLEARVIVLPGAYLHRGARVRAGSVVSRSVAAGATVGGIPLKVLTPGPA